MTSVMLPACRAKPLIESAFLVEGFTFNERPHQKVVRGVSNQIAGVLTEITG